MISLCNGWEFTPQWTDSFGLGGGEGTAVRLPHNVQEMPLHYADQQTYEMVSGYRRKLAVEESWLGKKLFLQFDGAAHIATVYLNGRELAHHRTGYTGFRVDITKAATAGENLLAVKLDSTENSAIPPFGFVVDYLTYGGLYREVWLDVREKSYIEDIYVTTPATDRMRLQVTAVAAEAYTVEVLDGAAVLLSQTIPARATPIEIHCPGAIPWDTENPKLYTCRVKLLDEGGAVLDTQETSFGFRTIEFRANEFLLNGKPVFLRGLNRHQCYPYMGYAAPESLQREDARILKEELGCVIARTSHYPQSHHFIDECDKLGLLVFTEVPGWQHVGDDAWQEQVVENTREMVLQYRNHPSIILWGVRVNESQDYDELYKRTNALAHELDPSRPTSGVRYFTHSHLLEDVYGFNDFSYAGGAGSGVRPRREVTKHDDKAVLVTENNGHMFPTKSFDTWAKMQEHAMRHARVQNDAAEDGEHVGCISWCMFDYGTHKDFGSGDRVCYHGVLDTFRNPKLAAAVYASQQEKTPVMVIGSSMGIGDYPADAVGDIYVFTNAEQVALYKNDKFVTMLSDTGMKGLPHPPRVINDRVGCLLQTEEGFPKAKAEAIRQCLLTVDRYGINNLPAKEKLRLAYVTKKYGMGFEECLELYNKYIKFVSGWGSEAVVWRLEGRNGDEVVSEMLYEPTAKLRLEVKVSHTALKEGNTYDMAAVRVRIVNEYGAPAPFAQLPVRFELSGAAALVGPDVATAEGGMCGTYVQTLGRSGEAKLVVRVAGLEEVTVDFTVEA